MKPKGYSLIEKPEGEFDVLVVVSCFNSAKTVSKTLQSIVSQDYVGDYRVLIHDDNSSDSTKEIANSFKESNPDLFYRIYRSDNSYVNNDRFAKWEIISSLDFKYLAMCDGDDFWSENMLSQQLHALARYPSAVISVSKSQPTEHGSSVDESQQEFKSLAKRIFSSISSIKPYRFSTSSMIQKAYSLDFEILRMVDLRPHGDLIRYHVALQYGSTVHQNNSTCYRGAGGVWATLPEEQRLEQQLETLKALWPKLNLRGKLGLIRPLVANIAFTLIR